MPRIYNNIVNNLYQRELSFNQFHSTPKSNANQIVKSMFGLSNSLYKTDLYFHKSCVNSVKFSNCGQFMVSGGDDGICVFSNVEQSLMKSYKPKNMRMEHNGNIFSIELNRDSTKVFTGGTDEQLIIHDTITGDLITSRLLDSAILNISMNPFDDNVIAISCEDGRILIYDCRCNLPKLTDNFYPDSQTKSIEYNPLNSNLLLVASSCDKDVSLIDLRNRETVFKYLSPFTSLKGKILNF